MRCSIFGSKPSSSWRILRPRKVSSKPCGERTNEALTRALAIELAPIRVNAVSPRVVRTNLWQNMSTAERELMYERVGNSLPVGRVGEPHDIAQAYLFLMHEGFVTLQTIVVDGGTVLV
jgi:NAD(P)-dependent dehydrogenase (short-subunit alcohol dehydrogenase family)